MTRRPLSTLLLALALFPACNSTEDAEKTARDASNKAIDASKEKAAELAEDAKDLGKEATDASKKAVHTMANEVVDASTQAVDDAADASKKAALKLFDDIRNDGELSQTAKQWLSEQASKAKETDIEAIVQTGVQLAPVALEASKVLADAVDSSTAIEPIFQKIEKDHSTVDKAISDMPRVEVVDGVTVGYKQMDELDMKQSVKQRGYLVMWRHEGYLLGFVYRSTRTIDLQKLIAETPRLLSLTQQALNE